MPDIFAHHSPKHYLGMLMFGFVVLGLGAIVKLTLIYRNR
jgi:hypothetical protein